MFRYLCDSHPPSAISNISCHMSKSCCPIISKHILNVCNNMRGEQFTNLKSPHIAFCCKFFPQTHSYQYFHLSQIFLLHIQVSLSRNLSDHTRTWFEMDMNRTSNFACLKLTHLKIFCKILSSTRSSLKATVSSSCPSAYHIQLARRF